jgi:sugar phosphate isomerase/epimerase
LARLRALADRLGVEIETGTSGSDPQILSGWIQAGRILGSRLMRTIFTKPSAGLAREKAQLLEILPELRSANMALAIENHETTSCRELRDLIEAVDDPLIGGCLDPVNSLGRGEGTWEVVEALMPVTLNLHVKDFTVTRGSTDMGFTVTGARTGEGQLEIPRLLERMRAQRPDVSVILEQWTPLTGSIDEAVLEQERWAVDGVTRLRKWVEG